MSNINKYREIMDRLKSEGKIKELNGKKNMKDLEELNEKVKRTKEEYKTKDANSQNEASRIILK